MSSSPHWMRKLALALAVPLLVAACGGGSSEPAEPAAGTEEAGDSAGSGEDSAAADLGSVTVAQSAIKMEYVGAELGQELGVWEDRGLTVENLSGVQGTGAVVQVMAAGEVDMAWMGGSGAANAIVSGLDGKIIAEISRDWRNVVVIAGADSGIESLEDLEGATMGYSSAGSVTDNSIRILAEEYGWERGTDIFDAQIGALPELTAALTAGSIDAFAWSTEPGFQLEEQGEGQIIGNLGELAGDTMYDVLVATNSMIAERPEVIEAYLEGVFETIAYMKDNPEETIAFQMELFDMTEFVVRSTYEQSIDNLSDDGLAPDANIEGVGLEVAASQEGMETPPEPSEYWDGQFVPVEVE